MKVTVFLYLSILAILYVTILPVLYHFTDVLFFVLFCFRNDFNWRAGLGWKGGSSLIPFK